MKDSLGPSRDEKRSSRTNHARSSLTLAPCSLADHRTHAALTSSTTR
eukprot:CAMPEP_0198681788 /NCGR_PEP_ID=MMETSP1468-20131203/7512_1 /TAXON_ID=1461545 /ORGANISM="Mantoniella sp, Strain CCMP1436" /LENGTH=46 /DNA_ID= /DNA_START= /DNA_END= /DNA_ORIENTATION=